MGVAFISYCWKPNRPARPENSSRRRPGIAGSRSLGAPDFARFLNNAGCRAKAGCRDNKSGGESAQKDKNIHMKSKTMLVHLHEFV